jgi:hypothetical protein
MLEVEDRSEERISRRGDALWRQREVPVERRMISAHVAQTPCETASVSWALVRMVPRGRPHQVQVRARRWRRSVEHPGAVAVAIERLDSGHDTNLIQPQPTAAKVETSAASS